MNLSDSTPAALRIIPRDAHNISRKQISSGALRVLYRLNEAGYAAYLVGGAVRDLLIGGRPKDFDVATDATPEDVRRLFRNCRLIGRRFRLAHVVFGQEIVEVATFRGNGGDDSDGDRHLVDGRIVRDNVWGTIEEDAQRRDFTVNALYYDIADFSVRDYVGGFADVQRRVLRLIGDPQQRYREDPVRMLRAVRLSAKLDFSIAAEARAPFAELGELLAHAPPARLFDETLKMFLAGSGLKSFHALEQSGLLGAVFPLTARALAFRGGESFRAIVEAGLAGTDARVSEGKSVTPAFLFAVLLWGAVCAQAEREIARGLEPNLAWQRVGHQVIAEQAKHVAIPRRFGQIMQEIWMLQPRLADRQKKRVFRLLAHPRFRGAYDFLLLRAAEGEAIAELGRWWTHAQQMPHEALAAGLSAAPDTAVSSPSGDGAKKRRRRRRKPSVQTGADPS
ncbi:MAG: polynucleotide adenylyltransferase PcnB [Xanthomonadaceae bacterium]|nr:polynucleotide adenylyltransferase PcnB [Xanthomonadaceae bacterium]